ncbi:MAG: hypothetical protein KKA73_17975, partial [Chloroflexi bacterium]|nr:hypothetical protein [Chloroflexota bacterium]
MVAPVELSDCTLSTEHQALVDALNALLAWLPNEVNPEVGRRLALVLLEAADVAPQAVLAQATGFAQTRSVRAYKQRLHEEGLAGLFDRPIPGRPAVTTQPAVESAFIQVLLRAVIAERAIPDDATWAAQVNQVLEPGQAPAAGPVTAAMIETLRLRWGIQRPALRQQLGAVPPAAAPDPAPLGRTQVGGAFILAILLLETGWLRFAQLLPLAPGYTVTATQWLLTALFAVIFGVRRALHLDDVCDIGFALLTGRPRPLTHGTFQHWQRAVPAPAAADLYQATAAQEVQDVGPGTRRISLDGHNLPRYTQVVDLVKGQIGNTGRIHKAEEMV